ncbi:primosomal protein N' [Nitrospirillum amazonense]|uniref:primosomal protein N' n=1 Tax=Nitrospirillum amazonense TaxID=28077 RepID=UPI0024125809|nr:primosomal protein N' [Nitrospirillum amazonense]MDG3442235.1 primosomal protein N' [Nitrospirillum amazonense]
MDLLTASGIETAAPPVRRVRVLLPLPLASPYDYRVPDDMELEAGAYVEVPLGPRHVFGVVWAVGGPGDNWEAGVAASRLKPVIRRFDLPPMPEVSRRFVDWVAAYTLSAPGSVLRMAVSVSAALEDPKQLLAYLPSGESPPPGFKMTDARRRVLALMEEDGPPRTPADLARDAACGIGVIRGLAESGLLTPVALRAQPRPPIPDADRAGPELSPDQAAAAGALCTAVDARAYSATLVDGVTGSGKTEVYFEAIAACLRLGRQALVLLPEIALSSQWLDRFARRFGVRPVEWHSDLAGAHRRAAWRSIANGEAPVVVGARSALFLPYPDLGLIVVDEEHEAAFKQEDGVIYHARDMAVARAFLGGIPVALVSATPSLETLTNAETGRYGRIDLPARHGGASLPEVTLIDLRRSDSRPPARHWLSPILTQAMAETLAAGEQAMLFLNRRGYAPLTLCRSCGFRLQCPNCTAWLVEHRLSRRLQCHHCGYTDRLPETCPSCEAEHSFVACGPGVERVAEEVAQLFPDARVALMTSDTLVGPHAIQTVIEEVRAHKVDILIGTQVMAKGHHFPMLTLVGVVDGDLGLGGGDLRAAERTFQMLHQVAGRAGRESRPGRVFLQTHMPEHPVMQALAAHDRDAFLAAEADQRRAMDLPPYGRLAALIISGEDERQVDKLARDLARAAPQGDDLQVLGPAPAPLALLRGRHRRRLLLKTARGVAVQPLLQTWLGSVPIPTAVRVQVDVDPYSFM